jgi:outer membrane protein assembly factor BamB
MDGRIYIVTPGALAALDPGNGEDLWQQSLSHEAAFPPLLTRDLVLVVLHGGKIVALAPEDGRRIWDVDLGCVPQAEPALSDHLLLAGCPDGTVSAFSTVDGQVLWHRMLPSPMAVKPAITQKRVFVGTEDHTVTCLSAGRGKRKYRVRLAGNPASELGVRGRLILAGSQDNLLYAIKQHHGHLAWSADAGSRLLTLPAIRGDVAVASPVFSDQLVILDLRDGAVTGRRFLPGEDRMSAGSPVFAGKTLVTVSQPIAGGPGWVSGMQLEVTTIPADPTMNQ